MSLLGLQETSKLINYSLFEGIGRIDINYHEVKCLEMAMYFLSEQLNLATSHKLFVDLRDYHVRNINHWLNNTQMRQSLYFDGSNTVRWPIVSSEDAVWLMLALTVGITEATIASMAMDDAYYGRDMVTMTAKTTEEFAYADLVFNDHYRDFHDYYCQIATCREILLNKFQKILNN